MTTILLYLYTESPLHAGVGTGLSVVDLPIQRERATQYPVVQGSGLKGALRSHCLAALPAENPAYNQGKQAIEAVFGPEAKSGDGNDLYAGAAAFGEARILLFPVRALTGVFAYVTCPHVLARLGRDAYRADILPEDQADQLTLSPAENNAALVTPNSAVVSNRKVVLEEFLFQAQPNEQVGQIANWLAEVAFPPGDEYRFWKNKVRNSLVILPDDAFRDFVVNSTEITTHVKLKRDLKTVDDAIGGLWTQEALPADAVLYSPISVYKLRTNGSSVPPALGQGAPDDVTAWLVNEANVPGRIQLGGDETTGQGVVALRWQRA